MLAAPTLREVNGVKGMRPSDRGSEAGGRGQLVRECKLLRTESDPPTERRPPPARGLLTSMSSSTGRAGRDLPGS